jgi:four helix bundle protein
VAQRLHWFQFVNYRNLDVYRKSVRFLPLAARIADRLPSPYAGLADQVRRASLSILLNIAEGSGKTSGPDQRRFYAMARGSAMECGAIIDACMSLELVDPASANDAEDLLSGVVQMLSKMCRG